MKIKDRIQDPDDIFGLDRFLDHISDESIAEFKDQLSRILALVEACQKKYPKIPASLADGTVIAYEFPLGDAKSVAICSALCSMENNGDV